MGTHTSPPPNAPPAYPNILPGANTAKRERLRAEHKVLYVHWAKYVHTGRIAVNINATAFEEWVFAALEDPNEGLNGFIVRNVYNYAMENYATISQAEVNANLETFNNPINTSRALVLYIRKQELCKEMAEDVNVFITKATMVTTCTKQAVATGDMDDACRGWMWLPNDQQIWVCWKTVWGGALLEKRELLRLTGIGLNGMVKQSVKM